MTEQLLKASLPKIFGDPAGFASEKPHTVVLAPFTCFGDLLFGCFLLITSTVLQYR